ncbi:CoA-binding protein, partial [Acinetobacter baumannii]
MSLYRLDRYFTPSSVAMVGATNRPGSRGMALLANMRRAGYEGALYPVNPHHQTLDGLAC